MTYVEFAGFKVLGPLGIFVVLFVFCFVVGVALDDVEFADFNVVELCVVLLACF